MNLSSLPVYYSKENITNRFVDNSNVYILPSICYMGIITSLACLVVSSSFKRRDDHHDDDKSNPTLDYIFLNSLIDLVFLLIQSFLFIFRCGALCPYGYTYTAKFYEIYIYLYIGYILVTSQVLLNIYVSVERLRMFSGKLTSHLGGSSSASNCSNSSHISCTLWRLNIFQVYFIFLLISVFFNAPPYLMAKEITPLGVLVNSANNSTDVLYVRTTRKEFQTSTIRPLLTILLVIKDPLMYLVLCAINILVCVKFRKFLYSKRQILKTSTSPSKKKKLIINLYFRLTQI